MRLKARIKAVHAETRQRKVFTIFVPAIDLENLVWENFDTTRLCPKEEQQNWSIKIECNIID
jgi:hypothetical protein